MIRRPSFVLILLCLMVAAAGGALARWSYVRHGDAQLLTADADMIPKRPAMMAFALASAAPLYRRQCAGCHGADLKGDPRRGAPDLTDADWLYGDGRPSEIEQTITYGIRSGNPKARNLASMPAFAQAEPYGRYHIPPLTPPEVRDVTEYLVWLEARPADAQAARRGDHIFHTNGGCYDCHGVDGGGDGATGAADLKDRIWLYGDGSRAAIFDSIAHGRAGACPAWINRLSAAQIRALALYIHSQARTARGPAA
jgi:cytochrome c oxidase cbb3-type subunit 3